jgi:hypothetical protein
MQSWRERPCSLGKARTYLSQEVAEGVTGFEPEVDAAEHLGIYLTDIVLLFLLNKCYIKNLGCYNNKHLGCIKLTSIDEFPNDVDDFLRNISPAFHPKYLKGF